MERQQLIMDKALELFAEKGINDTSVQEITDRCNMSKGAFYLAFKSKDELITALIDRFMMEYISDIDLIVKSEQKGKLLESFFIYSYQFSQKHQKFSHLYIKEQLHKLHEHLIEKVKYYGSALNDVIYQLVDKLYEHKLPHEKHELVWVIKSFMQIYQKYSFEMNLEIDLDLFVASCVEKINLIATHSEKSFITEDILMQMKGNHVEIDGPTLLLKFNEAIETIEEPVVTESLYLLKEHILHGNLSDAIVQGLLQNIQPYAACKELRYMYQKYLDGQGK